jgi:hypothetical protein
MKSYWLIIPNNYIKRWLIFNPASVKQRYEPGYLSLVFGRRGLKRVTGLFC